MHFPTLFFWCDLHSLFNLCSRQLKGSIWISKVDSNFLRILLIVSKRPKRGFGYLKDFCLDPNNLVQANCQNPTQTRVKIIMTHHNNNPLNNVTTSHTGRMACIFIHSSRRRQCRLRNLAGQTTAAF